jgi:hypothetical protein
MNALILPATPDRETAIGRLQAIWRCVLRGLDAFAQCKARRAAPEWQLRKADREINRYRRLMHAQAAAAGPHRGRA